jgi:hypothetical protein
MDHTKGPWKCQVIPTTTRSGDEVFVNIYSQGGYACGRAYGESIKECFSIARLIAVAPEYDELINEIANDLGYAEWATPKHAEDILCELIKKYHTRLRAAIAKSKGNL